jgi:RNA polymerase sigma factor (sigma-70 family)
LPPPETETARWFAAEVQPHEPALRGYLRGSFPAVRDVDDVVQESYLRMWRARAAQPIASAKAFLFQVARHLAVDLMRRERISPVAPVPNLAALPVAADEPGTADRACTQERVRLLADAIESLPARCREIIILRKIHGLSQKDTAARLGLSERTIEVQIARGVKRCEDFLRRRGMRGLYDDGL